jgi:hypothetical protein
MKKDWVWFVGGILAGALVVALCSTVSADVNFNGGYSGFFEWETPHSNVATGSAFDLGVTYRPDAVETLAPNKYQVKPESFEFFANGVVRDGQSDIGMIGGGYSLVNLKSIEFILEGAAVEKQIDEGHYALGAYAGLKMPFTTLGQTFAFTVGGGYCSNPIMVIGLNFLSQ